MQTKLKPIIFIFILFVFTQHSNAQEVWNWQKSIDYALQNNITIKQADLNIQVGESTLKQNKLNYSPNINGSSNYNLTVGNSYNFFTAEYNKALVHYQDYGLNINQPIFDGLIVPNSVKKSKFDLQALKLDQETLKNNVQLQILTAFLNIMNANEQYQQAINQKAITQEQFERLKTLIDAGAAAENALLDVESQLTNEDLNIAQIRNQRDLAYLSLRNILQIDPKKDFTVETPKLPEKLSLDSLASALSIYDAALRLRPEIKSSQAKIESAKKQIAVAKGSYFPTLNVVGNLNTFFSSQNKLTSTVLTGNSTAVGFVEGSFQRVLIPETQTIQSKNPYGKQLNQNFNYAVGLQLAVPLYNKYQVQTAVKQAKLQYQNSILTAKQTEFDLYNTIMQSYLKAQASINSYQAAEKNLTTAQRSYQYAVDRLEAGSINQLEVNLAKTNLSNAESKFTQTKYEYLFNTKLLDFYQGKKIEL